MANTDFEKLAEEVRVCFAEDNALPEDPPFTIDDPQNSIQATQLAAMAHEQGALFFIAIIKPEGMSWSVPFVASDKPMMFDDKVIGGLPEMQIRARRETKRGNNVFITTNSFTRPFYKKNNKQTAFRKAENCRASRTLVADLDVKEGAYRSREEALTDLGRVIKETGLPERPIIVNSGGGLHIWWCLDRTLPSPEWLELAPRFAALLEKHGLKFDRQCTSNAAGFLRLPGTVNFKGGKFRPVRLGPVAKSPCCSADTIIKIAGSFDAARRAARARSMLGSTGNFTAGVNDSAPPVDLDLAAAECPMLADTLATGGLGHSERQWRFDLLLAHFSTDPLSNAVRLSDGDPRFKIEEVTEKLETINDQQAETNFGWPQCTSFTKISPHCATCAHRDEGRSPLYFGLMRQSAGPAPEPAQPAQDGASDWLSDACRRHGVIAAGRYRGHILPHDIHSCANAKTSGVSFVIGIADGPFKNYQCRVNMACAGSLDNVIRRDLAILSGWARALAVGPTSDPVELVKALGEAGENRNITFDIGVNSWGGAETLFLKAVEIA